jgi:hypothetical protein
LLKSLALNGIVVACPAEGGFVSEMNPAAYIPAVPGALGDVAARLRKLIADPVAASSQRAAAAQFARDYFTESRHMAANLLAACSKYDGEAASS